MTQQYTCYDCTGRGGTLITFTIKENGEPYEYDPTHCPLCGLASTVETVESYRKRHD